MREVEAEMKEAEAAQSKQERKVIVRTPSIFGSFYLMSLTMFVFVVTNSKLTF